jgi:regulator of protease activity HflC (stomatin/prohibitin superfamily)
MPYGLPIQSQGIITRDNVSVDVSAVAYHRIVVPDPGTSRHHHRADGGRQAAPAAFREHRTKEHRR